MKLIIRDNDLTRIVDVEFNPEEIVAIQEKNINQALIDRFEVLGAIETLREMGAKKELLNYLIENVYKIKTGWDMAELLSIFNGHQKDAQLIRNLQELEKEYKVDFAGLLQQIEDEEGEALGNYEQEY